MSFQNSKVVITGAAGVYGRWITEAFAREGATLCLSDGRRDALERLAAELGIGPERLLIQPAELTSEASIEALVAAVEDAWGAPDVVVNSAGIYPFADLLDTSTELFDTIMAVNLRAPFLLCRGFARLMIAAGVKGSMVNIGSGAARSLRAGGVPYCVSKGALDRLSKGFALELAAHGIRVNEVEPGFSSRSESAVFPPGYVEGLRGNIPLGRESGPDDAANAVLFLCSDKAAYITGTSVAVDGGNSAGRRPAGAKT
jgi:3-oxoacyl-[acyl-carrier protein] reductase